MRSFDNFLGRAQREHGDKFDPSDLDPRFIEYYCSEARIRVFDRRDTVEDRIVRSGTVGVTTGWRPVFLLMHNVNSSGSSDILNRYAIISEVKHAGCSRYRTLRASEPYIPVKHRNGVTL